MEGVVETYDFVFESAGVESFPVLPAEFYGCFVCFAARIGDEGFAGLGHAAGGLCVAY